MVCSSKGLGDDVAQALRVIAMHAFVVLICGSQDDPNEFLGVGRERAVVGLKRLGEFFELDGCGLPF
jgi:hypothetical protein